MVTVLFNIADWGLNTGNGNLFLTQVYNPTYGNTIVVDNPAPIAVTGGAATCSLVPNSYWMEYRSMHPYNNDILRALLTFPTQVDNTTVNAVNFIASGSIPPGPNLTASYAIQAMFANTASYALNISPADSASFAATSSVTLMYPDIADDTAHHVVSIGGSLTVVSASGVTVIKDASGTFIYSDGENENIFIGEATPSNYGFTNVSIGNESMGGNVSGSFNTVLGYHALNGNQNGSNNTVVGQFALAVNEGSSNIAIGSDAGVYPTASNDSIFIGNQGQPTDTSVIRIGDSQANVYLPGTVNVNELALGANTLLSTGGTLIVTAGNVLLDTFSGVDVQGRLYNSNGVMNLDNTSGSSALSYINGGGGKFGLGTIHPQNALDVNGNISCSVVSASQGIFLENIGVGGMGNPGHQIDLTNGGSIGCSFDNSFYIGTVGAQTYFCKNGGTVGIGKVSGTNRLEVAGNISCSVVTASLFTGTASFAVTSSATLQFPDITDKANKVGINQTNPQFAVDVTGVIGNSATQDYRLSTGPSAVSWVNAHGGTFGVNQSSPVYHLDVNGEIGNGATGDFLISSAGAASYLNGNGGNVAIGHQSAGFTLDVNGTIGNSVSGEYQLTVGGGNGWVNAQGGNFGIGTNAPNFPCEIPGAIGNSLDGTSTSNYIVLNDGSGFMQLFGQYAVKVNCELDIGNGSYSDPSVGNAYDVKCGGPAGGITSLGAINTNGGYKISNVVFVDASKNVTASNINFTGNLLQNGVTYVPANATNAFTASFVTASNVHGVVATASLASVQSSGFLIPIMQAGTASVTASTSKIVTFNTAMANTNYVAQLEPESAGITSSFVSGKTKNGFTASFGPSYTGLIDWNIMGTTQ